MQDAKRIAMQSSLERAKHLKRMAKINRVAEIAKDKGDAKLAERAKALADEDGRRHAEAMSRIASSARADGTEVRAEAEARAKAEISADNAAAVADQLEKGLEAELAEKALPLAPAHDRLRRRVRVAAGGHARVPRGGRRAGSWRGVRRELGSDLDR